MQHARHFLAQSNTPSKVRTTKQFVHIKRCKVQLGLLNLDHMSRQKIGELAEDVFLLVV